MKDWALRAWEKRAVPTGIAAVLTVVAVYALLRGHDVLFRSEPNPATIMYQARVAMFVRLTVGGYVAAMVAVVVYGASARDLARTLTVVLSAIPVVGALIAAQAIFLP